MQVPCLGICINKVLQNDSDASNLYIIEFLHTKVWYQQWQRDHPMKYGVKRPQVKHPLKLI